jgi:undecaprenyl-diphosphatase
LLLEDFFESMFTRPHIASLLLLVTAGILAISERWARREQGAEELSWYGSLVVGLAQALAILPGISRSGATIAAGMGLGLRRESAARFSFLLATPITLGAGLLQTVSLAQSGSLTARAPALLAGFVAALLAGLVCIHFLLRYLQRHSLYPFALYCSLLGASGLLIYFLST